MRDEVLRGKQIVAYVVLEASPLSIPRCCAANSIIAFRRTCCLRPLLLWKNYLSLPAARLTASRYRSVRLRNAGRNRPTSPQTRFEKKIAGIWKEVLGRASVGIHDNFFDLGGHSLLLTQVHARLQKLLHARLPMVKLFEYPTVVALAAYLEAEERTLPAQMPQSEKLKASRIAHAQKSPLSEWLAAFPALPPLAISGTI